MNSNLERLVLAVVEEGDEAETFYALTQDEPDVEGANICEDSCGRDGGEGYGDVPEGTRTFVWKVYDDEALTIRQRQTGGDTSICEDCLVDSIYGSYDQTPEYAGMTGRWFVRPEGDLPTPVRVYGGC